MVCKDKENITRRREDMNFTLEWVKVFLSTIDVRGAVASWLVRPGFKPWPGTLCCVLGQAT